MTRNCCSALNRSLYILKTMFKQSGNISLFQSISDICKYGWILKIDSDYDKQGSIRDTATGIARAAKEMCEKIRDSREFLIKTNKENPDYFEGTDITRILKEDLSQLTDRDLIIRIKKIYDAQVCCHYGDFIELVNLEDDLETIISTAFGVLHAVILPCIATASLLFGPYVFEMSYDDDHPTLAAPLVILFIAWLFPYFGIYWCYKEYRWFKKRQLIELEQEASTSASSSASASISTSTQTKPKAFNEPFFYFLLQSYLKYLIIPALRCNVCRNPKSDFSKLRCNIPWFLCFSGEHKERRIEKQPSRRSVKSQNFSSGTEMVTSSSSSSPLHNDCNVDNTWYSRNSIHHVTAR